MIKLREGEHLLAVYGTLGGPGFVFMLGHVEQHELFVAPLGSPPFDPARLHASVPPDPPWAPWVRIGAVDDLPDEHMLGDIKSAWRRTVAGLS